MGPTSSSQKRNPFRSLTLIPLLFVLILAGVGARLLLFAVSPLRQIPAQGIVVEIHKGDSPRQISRLLVDRGVLSPADDNRFLLLGKLGRYWKQIKAGEYQIGPSSSPSRVFSILVSGISMIHPLTVREGENIYEIAKAIEDQGLAAQKDVLKLCRDRKLIAAFGIIQGGGADATSIEGYLFPDTYYFNKTMTPEDMLKQMHRGFLAAWGEEQDKRARELGMNRHQIITLASIIEKETGASFERPLISSVFHNRLKLKMRLQSDPTTIYGIWDRYKGNLHKADLLIESPYNTYTLPALPIGPISNPGKESIRAALYPSPSDYLFFVSHNDGTHQFSRSYEEHQLAVRKFQLDPKARDGKSWRDLSPDESRRESAHSNIHQK